MSVDLGKRKKLFLGGKVCLNDNDGKPIVVNLEEILIGIVPEKTDVESQGFKKNNNTDYVYELEPYSYKKNEINFLKALYCIDGIVLTDDGKEKIEQIVKKLKDEILNDDDFDSFRYDNIIELRRLRNICDKFDLNDLKTEIENAIDSRMTKKEKALESKKRTSIAAQIIKDAMINWGDANDNDEAEEIINKAEDFEALRKNTTQGSDLNAIDGMGKTLNLSDIEIDALKSQISTSDKISKRLAKKIRNKMQENPYGIEGSILEILSYVHDEWCINHPDNFLKENRNKEFQFVNFLLLNWEEASKALVFLKPILEACGIRINESKLERVFLEEQEKFLIEKNLINDKGNVIREQLEIRLAEGANFYQPLQGLKVENGKNITDLLFEEDKRSKNGERVYQTMASQVAEKLLERKNIDRTELIKKEILEIFWEKITEEKAEEIAEVMAEVEKNMDLTNEIFGDILYKMYYNEQEIDVEDYVKKIENIQAKRAKKVR